MKSLLFFVLVGISCFDLGCSRLIGSPGDAGTSGHDPSEFSGHPGDCQKFISHLPHDYFHDWLEVPENPLAPSSQMIRVFYYGKMTDQKNIIVFFNGGPTSDSHGNHTAFEHEMINRGLTGKYSFVFMDQRGTGCSNVYPQGRSNDILERLKWYGSTGIVYDAEALRKKLIGAQKWKIFGQSYGAFIVHRYVTLFPQSIDKAYAHANTISPDPVTRLDDRIFSQVRVLSLYLQNYPDDLFKLQKLKALLTTSTCVESAHSGKFCGHDFQSELISQLGFSNRWPKLHEMIGQLLSGDQLNPKGLESIVKSYFDNSVTEGRVAATVIGFYDRNVAPMDSQNCGEVYRRIKDRNGLTDDQFLMNECMPGMQRGIHSALRDHVEQLFAGRQDLLMVEAFKISLIKMPPGSFFLYSGERDCFVPKESFGPEITTLNDTIHYTHFPNSGHEGYRTEAQVWNDLAR